MGSKSRKFRCRIPRNKSWLVATIVFLLIGLGLFIAGLFTPSWMQTQCGDINIVMGIWKICAKNSSTESSSWLCQSNQSPENGRIHTPFWLRNIQYMSYLGLAFVAATLLICCMFMCAKVDQSTMGIAGICSSCAAVLIVIVILSGGHFTHGSPSVYVNDISQYLFNVTCKTEKFNPSYSLLLTGVATVVVSLGGIWALLATCLLQSGLGNITSRGLYSNAPTTVIPYEFEVNIGYSDDSDSDDVSSYTNSDIPDRKPVSRHDSTC